MELEVTFVNEPVFAPGHGTSASTTGLGCPECAGVLHVEREGVATRLRFVCRIGHAFSLEGLVASKEGQLERATWSVLAILEEIVSLHRQVVALASDACGRASEERIAQARAQTVTARQLVEMRPPARCEETSA